MSKLGAQPSLQDRPLELAGNVYTLRFGIRSVEYLKEKWGVKTGEDVQARIEKEGDSVPVLVDLLRSCLQTWHRDLSDEDCLEIIDALGALVVGGKINDAVVAAMPQVDPSAPQVDAAQAAAS